MKKCCSHITCCQCMQWNHRSYRIQIGRCTRSTSSLCRREGETNESDDRSSDYLQPGGANKTVESLRVWRMTPMAKRGVTRDSATIFNWLRCAHYFVIMACRLSWYAENARRKCVLFCPQRMIVHSGTAFTHEYASTFLCDTLTHCQCRKNVKIHLCFMRLKGLKY